MNKKMTLRILSTAAALGMLTSTAAFAAEPVTPEIDLTNSVVTAPMEAANITVNGLPAFGKILRNAEDKVLIPVRAVAEALGYEVGWEEEANRVTLTRGAQYITMTLDEDAYTFSRMAPVALGSAPVLVDDSTTYVPEAFLSEILATEYSVDGDKIDIIEMKPVTVTSVDLNENVISVKDDMWDEVIVYLNDDTVITNAGKPATKEDIKEDSLIHILYAPAMTMSLPPQTSAVKIEVNPNAPVDLENEEQVGTEESVAFEGTIKEIISEDQILVDINGEEVVLNISDETNIHHEINKMRYTVEDLEVGMKISGSHSMIMTRSLPPQTPTFEIVITD